MDRWVEIAFDCLPLRSVARLDPPLDASPKLAAKFLRIKHAFEKHGAHNTYYLHNAHCIFHLTNDPNVGMVHFRFEGTIFTDIDDLRPIQTDFAIEIEKEDCDWLDQSVVDWFKETVKQAVLVEFARYIAAGDLSRTRERMKQIEKAVEAQQGFVGMYL